ncbi:MAG TPA: ABC transporter permease [Flavilitoribacter sp.]|nr:ABC transporter permease [Flavilitoribacter sp.]HMQ86033.1 ABC transporter permease [Flavilitoribacter sp.]
MLKNYIKMALRQIWRNKTTSVINILGLSIGLTSCLLILQYVAHEKSYDQFHRNRDRIFRVAMFTQEQDEPEQSFAFTFPAK